MNQELKVYHSSNEVEDICILNGLCKLLEMNDVDFKVEKLSDYYSLKHETFNYEEARYNPINEIECYTCNSSSNKSEKLMSINGANEFFKNNVVLTFKYFSIHNDELLKKEKMKKDAGSICNGSFFNTKGVRASTSAKSLKIYPMQRFAAFLGWVSSTNYIRNDDVEINVVIIPKVADRIIRPYEYRYPPDKETNEIKVKTYCGKREKRSDIIMLAEIYANTATEYLLYKKDNDYEIEDILFMMLTKSGQKPLPNKCFQLPVYNWNRELYLKLVDILSRSYGNYDVRDVTARFILKPSLVNFHKLIHVFSKKNQLLELRFKEDLVNMYNNKVQEIHNNVTVQKLGRALNLLIYNKRGFEILTRLYTVRTCESLAVRIREIEDSYIRLKSSPILNKEEHTSLINLIDTNKDAVICANAIISYGRVFYKAKKTNSQGKTDIKEADNTDNLEQIVDEISMQMN